MLSDRNTKYTEALIREGKNFDYYRWLDQVRDEEAQAKRVAAASNSREPAMPQPSDPAKGAAIPNPSPRSRAAAEIQKLPILRSPISRTESRDPKRSKKSIAWRLGRVCDEWDRFQESRNRDAVYGYLRAVFSMVKHYSGRRRTRRLMRRAFKFAGLPVDMTADPFAVVIRSTCEQKVDRKTLSKWSRCLRYAARFKKPRVRLMPFIKNRGGINGCADLFAKELGRHRRPCRTK